MRTPDALRIGYVLKRYPRFSETFVVNEILAHERAGLAIEIFALGPVEESHFQDGIARVRAPVHRLAHRMRTGEALWQMIRDGGDHLPGFTATLAATLASGDDLDVDDLGLAIQLALAARARGLSHLHAHFATSATTVARLAAAFAGIGYSFTAHAKDIYFDYETPQHLDRKLADAAFAVTVSDYNRSILEAAHASKAERLFRLYNGVDLARLQYGDGRGRPGRLLAVGRLVHKKGFHVLIEAARLLRDRGVGFDCQIVGDGEDAEALQARIDAARLGNQVRLVGAQPQPVVLEAMREAALLVAPCVISNDGNRDGLPTVLLEAMALGTPVVSTAVTGIPELVRDGLTGLCVAPGDAPALANALERLLGDAGLGRQLARTARLAIEADFDIDINARQLREHFQAAITATTTATTTAAITAAITAASGGRP